MFPGVSCSRVNSPRCSKRTSTTTRSEGARIAGKAALASRREELQRVPASAPGRRGCLDSLEDGEVRALPGEEIADRDSSLAASDHDNVVTVRGWVHRCPGLLLPVTVRPNPRPRGLPSTRFSSYEAEKRCSRRGSTAPPLVPA